MNSCALLMLLLSLTYVTCASLAGGHCPPPSWVMAKPECRETYQCRYGICCPNYLGKKSCVNPVNRQKMDRIHAKHGGNEKHCNGMKCNASEVCKPDPITKILRCQKL